VPVVVGIAAGVLPLEIARHDVGIDADHLQRGVAQQALQRQEITAVAQELGGEGVTEAMRSDAR